MSYAKIGKRLRNGGTIILDGGTGTELERRGVAMNPEAWCGAASIENAGILADVHTDYIRAGADIITVNSYASSRLMLEAAGLGDQVNQLNIAAINAAQSARDRAGNRDVLIAGSLSHMYPMSAGTSESDLSREPSLEQASDAFSELAELHKQGGCDLILLEMMFHPKRMQIVFDAALATGLPVWAGLSARPGKDGEILSFAADQDIAFDKISEYAASRPVEVIGVMHTPSNLVAGCLESIRNHFSGPMSAYPDSGYFKMPDWQFENIISPDDLLDYAKRWTAQGAQVIGGCCGLSPKHIEALAVLKS